jgi:transposase-like protein
MTLGLLADRQALEVDALQSLARHTGFAQVRALLLKRFDLQAGHLIAQEQWWLRELLALNERLIQQLERGERLRPQQLIALEPLRLNPSEKQDDSAPVCAVLQTALYESPQPPAREPLRCIYCGSTDVSPKSAQPRLKRIIDQFGVAHGFEVFRHYCHNPACPYQSFTALPAGVLPHSAYPVQLRLRAVELYLNLLSSYRRSARVLGVKASTVYHWLANLSPAALQLAAYLGVVRTSGVVGLDDKWVKVCSPAAVPKHGTRPRAVWRYAYFAVDVYSLDLLALELYPEHNDQAVRLFLLELKARGIQPRVVVSDLDPAYARVLPEVFPSAIHHECIFHALQNAQRQLTQVYGKHYRESIPAAATLHEQLVNLLRARAQKTVRQRFAELMALRESYVMETPPVACVFDSLETHFPKLVNAIESPTIPRTNNATELVIRRFDQHYQGMCGFDSSESAQVHLRLFALVYRLTPFAADNPNQAIRGRCPLDLAGYDLTALPLAQFFSQPHLPLPLLHLPEVVPMA